MADVNDYVLTLTSLFGPGTPRGLAEAADTAIRHAMPVTCSLSDARKAVLLQWFPDATDLLEAIFEAATTGQKREALEEMMRRIEVEEVLES